MTVRVYDEDYEGETIVRLKAINTVDGVEIRALSEHGTTLKSLLCITHTGFLRLYGSAQVKGLKTDGVGKLIVE